jgi:hypothetical protein
MSRQGAWAGLAVGLADADGPSTRFSQIDIVSRNY